MVMDTARVNLADARAYRRLAALIRRQIGDGTLQPGRPAPFITTLSPGARTRPAEMQQGPYACWKAKGS
jgi:hypothetical protein